MSAPTLPTSHKRRAPPSAERVRELLQYNPVTGALTWRATHGKHRAGELVGCTTTHEYRVVVIEGCRAYAHVFAWVCHTGAWPDGIVGFKNRDPRNMRFDNLQHETAATNQQRRTRARSDSGTQVLGVVKVSGRASPYLARIVVNRKVIGLGYHRTAEAAGQAYQAAKARLHSTGGATDAA